MSRVLHFLWIVFSLSAIYGQDTFDLLPYQDSFRFYQASQTDNQENLENLEKEIIAKLNNFYRNHFEKKDADDLMIHFDLPFDFTPFPHWSSDKRRLYIRELFKSEQKKYLIAEAPNMFYAHYAIAKTATQKEQYEKAALHLSQALRFRTLKMSENVLLNQKKNIILGGGHEEVIFANAYAKAKNDWLRSKAELKNKQRRYWVLYDRSFSPQILQEQKEQEQEELAQLKEELPNLKERVEQEQKNFAQMKKDFVPVQKKYNQASADFLEFFIEAMVRQDQRIRILQKSAYQMHQYTRNYSPVIPEVMPDKQDLSLQDNIYSQMLHLDPNRFAAWIKLGEINYLKGDFPKSLASYSSGIKILEQEYLSDQHSEQNEFLEKQNLLYATYKKLSAISLLVKKYPQAAYYLEKATAIQNNNNQIDANMRQANIIQLSRLYSRYNGNYLKSFELLQENAQEIMQRSLENLVNESNIENSRLRTDMQILHNYAVSAQKIKNFSAFENARLKGIAIHQAVLQLLNNVYNQEKQINRDLKNLRAQRENDSANTIAYNQKKMELEETLKKQQIVLATRNSLPIFDFYLSLAQHYENHGNLIKAGDILQQAVRLNVQPSEARKKLLLLEQKLK